jgi:monoamine oxidase
MFGSSDEHYHIRGGNQQIPVAIANYLGPDAVKYGQRMQKIAQTPAGRYDVTFTNATGTNTVTADIVLICTPFAVLRDLDYSQAGFDARKDNAIQNLGKGRQSKQHLQFNTRIWNELGNKPDPGTGTSYGDTGYQSSWETSRAQPGTNGILVGYAGGHFADAMHSQVAFSTSSSPDVQADAQRFLGQIEPVFNGITAAWNGKSTQGLPHLDPNMKCSYSFFRPGQYTTIAGYERVRQGNVFFAGEHCSFDFQGFMEGAAAEGARAGNEILQSIGIQLPKK